MPKTPKKPRKPATAIRFVMANKNPRTVGAPMKDLEKALSQASKKIKTQLEELKNLNWNVSENAAQSMIVGRAPSNITYNELQDRLAEALNTIQFLKKTKADAIEQGNLGMRGGVQQMEYQMPMAPFHYEPFHMQQQAMIYPPYWLPYGQPYPAFPQLPDLQHLLYPDPRFDAAVYLPNVFGPPANMAQAPQPQILPTLENQVQQLLDIPANMLNNTPEVKKELEVKKEQE